MYFSMKLIIMICIYTAVASDYKTIVSMSTSITSVIVTDNGGTSHSYYTSFYILQNIDTIRKYSASMFIM